MKVEGAMIDGEEDRNSGSKVWHIERGVPLAGILTIVFMLIGQWTIAAWYVARLDARIEVVEKAAVSSAPNGERLTRVEVKLDSALETVKDVQKTLSAIRPTR